MSGYELFKHAFSRFGRSSVVFLVEFRPQKVQATVSSEVTPTCVDDDALGVSVLCRVARFPRADFGGGFQVTSVGTRTEYDADTTIRMSVRAGHERARRV